MRLIAEPKPQPTSAQFWQKVDPTSVLQLAKLHRIRVTWRSMDGSIAEGTIAENGCPIFIPTAGTVTNGFGALTFQLLDIPLVVPAEISTVSAEHFIRPIEAARELETRAFPRVSLRHQRSTLRWFDASSDTLVEHQVPIVDLGASGFRTRHSATDTPPPRTPFAAILDLDGASFSSVVQLRNATTDGAFIEYGFECRTRATNRRLSDIYLKARFPRLRPRRDVTRQELLHLFSQSGYLRLRPNMEPSESWLSMNADEVARDVVYTNDQGEAIGHVSLIRAYSTTWLGHQIAMLRGHQDTSVSRAQLYQYFSLLPRLMDGSDAKLLGYFHREQPWHRVFFERFAEWTGDERTCVIVPWDRYEGGEDLQSYNVTVAPDLQIRRARGDDLAIVSQIVRNVLPPLAADALDIFPDLLDRDALHAAFARTQLHRGRQVFVLARGTAVLAAALCETGSPATTLFNVLNMAQIFVAPGWQVSADIANGFQAHIRRFYRDRGITDPIVVTPPGSFRADAYPGVVFSETMGCIVWSETALRTYPHYVDYQLAAHMAQVH